MSALSEGLVIAHLGKGIAVETGDQTILCQTLRKLGTIVVGDRVLISLSSPEQGRIEQLLPRRSVLHRPSRGDQIRPVAANIDTIFVVFAVEPECDFLLLDQYLAICENCNIDAALALNKIDLGCPDSVEQELQNYLKLGYNLHRLSANQNIGLDRLREVLSTQTSMLTGQSGVGKSSLTNAL
ncbi:MAG: ribosome small subunit-dependent GTPase A, partial [Methylomonas sp.]|nr:ribosome small subunit-dependent GTPase A [Methylomonas sp.]